MTTTGEVRTAFRLIDRESRSRLRLIAAFNVAIAILDALGLLLLVPFLSYLGQGVPTATSLTGRLLGSLGLEDDSQSILLLAALAGLLFLLKGIAATSSLWFQSGVLNAARHRLSTRFVWQYVRAPWLVNRSMPTGEVIRAANTSVAAVTNGVASSATSMFADAASLLAVVVALAIVDPVLTLGAMAYVAILGIVFARVVRRRLTHYGGQIQRAEQRLNTSLIELVEGTKELSVAGATRRYVKRYEAALDQYMVALRVINVTSGATRYLLESSMIVGVALVVAVATVVGSNQSLIIAVGVILAGGIRALPAINGLVVGFNTIRASAPGVQMLDDAMARLESGSGVGRATHAGEAAAIESRARVPGTFRFEDVSFRYPGRSSYALSGLRFAVGEGESIGVVGRSGSGKSTLIDLVLGLIEPTSGDVFVGHDSAAPSDPRWWASIGFVPQDVFLFDDSVEANITLDPGVDITSRAEIDEIVEMVGLSDFVAGLPEGLSTTLGERGAKVSGGQRQRIGIARALFRRPELLLLDEATSAVDNETEHEVSRTINALRGHLTIVIVAHRLSTVRACDRILFLDHGRPVAFDTFEALRKTNQDFSRLVELGSLE